METIEYQFSKTLRFGLTLKDHERKNKTHQTFKDLIGVSAQRIKEDASRDHDKTEQQLVTSVAACVKLMHQYLDAWEKIYRRTDQLALTKDFYKQMAKKACFDAYWLDNKERKQPQSQIIAISSLRKKHDEKERKDYILDYWADNISITKQRIHEFEKVIDQFKKALENKSMAHNKPHLVDFRKMFLSLTRLCNETLIPICNDSICFPALDKLQDNARHEAIKTFASEDEREERKGLSLSIKDIKEYFEENGGYVPLGKVTLNRYTAEQKPNNFKEDIKKKINDLRLTDLIQKLINLSDEEIKEYFEFNGKQKKQLIDDTRLSVVERVQLFKYKPIPAAVRFMLAEYLHKNNLLDKERVMTLFEIIGKPRSIGEEYTKLKDTSDFDLFQYPLKPAFDYAWENVARNLRNDKANAYPKEQCIRFLENIFEVSTSTTAFILYADLLFIKDNLSTLEHEKNSPKDKDQFIENIKRTFKNINYGIEQKEYIKHQQTILDWINKKEDAQKELKNANDNSYKNYENAKQQFGLLRGRQKNSIRQYKDLTETFKTLAVSFGKNFAELREKLREENEINKITHFGIIVEDSKLERYVLLSKLDEDKTLSIDHLLIDEPKGELKSYQVKSLMPKSLEKIIKNKGGYKDFHTSSKYINFIEMKRDWANYKNKPELVDYVKDCLQHSTMSKDQHWAAFGCDFTTCNSYEAIERELEIKAYRLKASHISITTVQKLVNEENCILLPFVNQDITSAKRELKNQFSKDWDMLFENNNDYRLHPEFRIVYRQPTPDYPLNKRYSRFQLIAHLMCEYIPQSVEYISRKQQIQIFNDKNEQKKQVDAFNERVKPSGEYYVLGIDRGLKQLATLCVLNNEGQIQGGFEVFTRTFDSVKQEWKHNLLEKRAILDLSNLRVETTVNGDKVLVDLASILVKDEQHNYTKDNQQKIKLKQLAYIRKLQFQMQHEPQKVLNFIKDYTTPQAVGEKIGELITPYKEGTHYDDLPIEKIYDMLQQFHQFTDEGNETAKKELTELDSADDLKTGVVANMVGVIAFMLEKYHYNAFVSLENLCRAFGFAKDGLNGELLVSTAVDNTVDFKDQENLVLAGLGTYHYFEMQLLKKLFRIQTGNDIIHLVPAFRSVDNYETIRKLSTKTKDALYTCKPFGVVHFIDPMYTSKKCPACDSINVSRFSKQGDIISCNKCGFQTRWDTQTTLKNNALLQSYKKQNLNLHYILNGDDNGAYRIALKTFANLT